MRPMRIAGAPRHRRRPRRPANSPRGGPPRQPESPSAVAPLFLAVREPSPSCLCAVAEAVTTANRQALRRACRRLAVEVSQQPAGSATTAHAQARACACMRATERRARVVRRQGCETALGPDARRSRPSARRRAGEREWGGRMRRGRAQNARALPRSAPRRAPGAGRKRTHAVPSGHGGPGHDNDQPARIPVRGLVAGGGGCNNLGLLQTSARCRAKDGGDRIHALRAST